MTEKQRDGGKSWKIAIAGLIGIFLIAMAASMVLAARRVSKVVDADYYQHGLHYGDKSYAQGKR
jgi:hypothetical protein